VRFKFGGALQAWQPTDGSAHQMLRPWAAAFDAPAMEALLARCVVPKLVQALRQLVVNPQVRVRGATRRQTESTAVIRLNLPVIDLASRGRPAVPGGGEHYYNSA
jgi:capsid protein